MTGTDAATEVRRVYYHEEDAPAAAVVTPSAFVAVRDGEGRLLLVRRCDSGAWELPGGRVDVGETAVGAAAREVAEEAGIDVAVTGLVGVFSDPGHVIRARTGEVRQQFALVFRAEAAGGAPHGDGDETSEVAWVPVADVDRLPVEPASRLWIAAALAPEGPPLLR
ncbi:NUDIX domain-containing protein [Blastococcus sp. SYSU D00695]